MDFIHDQLASGRRFRCLTLVDDFTRQCLALHVVTSIGGTAVVAVLEQLARSRGLPANITTDNGPEFTGRALHLWAQAAGVSINHIQPGKPMQNAFIESFNGTFRDDCLNQHWFNSLAEARLLINHWRQEYNHLRPHRSIGRIPPNSFALLFPPNNPHSIHLSPKLACFTGGSSASTPKPPTRATVSPTCAIRQPCWGHFTIHSSPGHGTRIHLEAPIT